MDALHGGHTCKLHTIFDDVVDLTIAHLLCEVRVQIRYARVLVCADYSLAVTIYAVTVSASRYELLSPLFECHIVIGERIGSLAFSTGDGKVAYRTRRTCFDCEWSR